MFGHVLRMPVDTPAQKALEFAALVGATKYQARKGRYCSNLLSLLRSDLKDAGLGTFKTGKKLRELRMLAEDKAQWIKLKKDCWQLQDVILNYYSGRNSRQTYMYMGKVLQPGHSCNSSHLKIVYRAASHA